MSSTDSTTRHQDLEQANAALQLLLTVFKRFRQG
jgi:hypothetical protein